MVIAGGDWRFFYPENIHDFAGLPSAWDPSLNTGVGISSLPTMWITTYLNLTSIFSNFGFSWNTITVLFWLIPPIFIGVFGAYNLYTLFWKDKSISPAIVSSVIYILNTYILMILSGGQLGVVFAYSLLPILIFSFIKNIRNPNIYNSLAFGLLLSIQILFDPRITIISLIPISLYSLFMFKAVKRNWNFVLGLPLALVLILHNYWLIPLILYGRGGITSLGVATSSPSFFSFAYLENTLAFLHPNWPDNLFGKVYFMRPEFLIIPIAAFSALIFKKAWNRKVAALLVLLLISVFFAKGTNDPFGFLYVMFFKHLPGFSVFRDPTKFYILIALCYSLLIPRSLQFIDGAIHKKLGLARNYSKFTFLLAIFIWFLTLYPLFTLQVKGLLKLKTLPNEYVALKNYVSGQHTFFRTLWIPQWQRYGYFSNEHPAIGRGEIFKSSNPLKTVKELDTIDMQKRLQSLGVKYVIVPLDSEEEIFLDDHKYSELSYKRVVDALRNISWLKEVKNFGHIVVFQTPTYNQKFLVSNPNTKITYKTKNATEYALVVKNAQVGEKVIFSESFDKGWEATIGSTTLNSTRSGNGLNEFILPNSGDFNVRIRYMPQILVNIGFTVSFVSFLALIVFLLFGKRKVHKATKKN